jgi:hypothetical protein
MKITTNNRGIRITDQSKRNVDLFELTLFSTDNTHEFYGDYAYVLFMGNFINITSIFHTQINRGNCMVIFMHNFMGNIVQKSK